jgi:pyrroline-5-carboxylate reductase
VSAVASERSDDPTAFAVDLQVVGGGRMGEALLRGLLEAGGATPERVRVVELDAARRDTLTTMFPGVEVTDAVGPAAATVLAVKPADTPAAASAVAAAGTQRVLSIAAGVTITRLEEALGVPVAVLRCMPNTPAQVGRGASALAAGTHAGEDDLLWAEGILGAVGVTVRVEEPLLDAVTGLSGSGPAYVFLLVEALVAAGVAEGLDPAVAGTLVVQTVAGAAAQLDAAGQHGLDADEHRRSVTSPNGTTAAGLAVLDDHGFVDAVTAAVRAATERSRQLGQS